MTDLIRLRLILKGHILWLRSRWNQLGEHLQGLAIPDAQADMLLDSGDDREGEARFCAEDPEALAVTAELDALPPSRNEFLDRLTEAFALEEFDRAVLIAALAPNLDASFTTLYAYAQDDPNKRYLTPHLCFSLFGRAEASFAADAPLRRFRLIDLESGNAAALSSHSRAIRLADRIAEFLTGIEATDPLVSEVARPAAAVKFPSSLEPEASAIEARLRDAADRSLNLTGPADATKLLLAREVFGRLGFSVWSLDAGRLGPAGDDRESLYRLLARESRLLRVAYFVHAPERDPNEAKAPALFADLIERLEAPVIVASAERWICDRPLTVFAAPRLTRKAQAEIWHDALATDAPRLGAALDDIVQQFSLAPDVIVKASAEARSRALYRGEHMNTADLWHACRLHSSVRLEDMAQRIESVQGWDDIVLADDTLAQLKEIAGQVARRAQVYERWGFARKLQRGRGITALFSGQSGVGKTMAAEVLSKELDLDLFRIDLSGIVSKYIGETEKNLRRVFDAAEHSGAVLFFDEADALFGKRTEVKDSHDRYANIEVNYLLQRMEEYSGLAILATNRKSALDRAFLRRLRFLVDFPFPDDALRQEIWRKVFPKEAPLEDVDYAFLARLQLAGGNIRNIALNAAFLAANKSRPIGSEELMHAIRREYAKIDKLVTESEFGRHYERMR